MNGTKLLDHGIISRWSIRDPFGAGSTTWCCPFGARSTTTTTSSPHQPGRGNSCRPPSALGQHQQQAVQIGSGRVKGHAPPSLPPGRGEACLMRCATANNLDWSRQHLWKSGRRGTGHKYQITDGPQFYINPFSILVLGL